MVQEYLINGNIELSGVFDKHYIGMLDAVPAGLSSAGYANNAGIRRSRSLGQSLEFSDYRDYVQGDDTRRIDWKGYVRTQRLFTKLYNEERQANTTIIIDCSKSMDFGSPNKARFAKLLAASLSYVALKNLDKIRITALDNQSHTIELSAIQGFPRIVSFLEKLEMGMPENRDIVPIQKKGKCFIISDFLHTPETINHEELLLNLARSNQSTALVHILSPEESTPALDGYVRLIDSETNQHQEVLITKEILHSYNEALNALFAGLRAVCAKSKSSYTRFGTDSEILSVIGNLVSTP